MHKGRRLLRLGLMALLVQFPSFPLQSPFPGQLATTPNPCRGSRCPSPTEMATQFIDVTNALGTLDQYTLISVVSSSVDTDNKVGGYGSMKLSSGGNNDARYASVGNVMADAGRRTSVWFMADSLIANRNMLELVSCFKVGLDGGATHLTIVVSGSVVGTGSYVLAPGTFFRIAVAYTITSTTVNQFRVYVNGVPDISLSNVTLPATGQTELRLLVSPAAASDFVRYQHLYIDNGTNLGDPAGSGNHLYTTAKLPTANGSNNAYTTNGSATGTGTGHAAWVSDRPWSSTDFLNQTSSGSLDEDYAIQGAAVGDDDISATSGSTVIAHASWQMAQLTGSGAPPTMSIFDNGVVTAFTPAGSFGLVTHITDSATYPVTAPIIGQRSTKGSGKVPALAAAGIVFAYTKAFPIGFPVAAPRVIRQAVNRASRF